MCRKIFKHILLKENYCVLIQNSVKFVPPKNQLCYMWCPGAELATSHKLNQWWHGLWRHMASLGQNGCGLKEWDFAGFRHRFWQKKLSANFILNHSWSYQEIEEKKCHYVVIFVSTDALAPYWDIYQHSDGHVKCAYASNVCIFKVTVFWICMLFESPISPPRCFL